jgi:hypothetical protein
MLISTCFILRQSGVHIATQIIREMPVSTLITGKTSEENLIYSIMRKSNVSNGRPRTLFKPMQTAASMSIDANFLMAGKSKNTILSTTKCMLADKLKNAKSHIAPTIIRSKTEDNLLTNSLSYSQRTEGR